jgi:hypothetical protein
MRVSLLRRGNGIRFFDDADPAFQLHVGTNGHVWGVKVPDDAGAGQELDGIESADVAYDLAPNDHSLGLDRSCAAGPRGNFHGAGGADGATHATFNSDVSVDLDEAFDADHIGNEKCQYGMTLAGRFGRGKIVKSG